MIALPADLRVLSLLQPWATLLVDPDLPKTIETRGYRWPSTIPLPVWMPIHASAKRPGVAEVGDYTIENWDDGPRMNGPAHPWQELPLGAVVGLARFTACLPIVEHMDDARPSLRLIETCGVPVIVDHGAGELFPLGDDEPYGDYTPGRYGWLTDRTIMLPQPVPYRNGLGFRHASDDLAAQITEQLRDAA